MISEVLKHSYDDNLKVKITLKDTDTPVIGTVVGGSRSVAGESVDYLSFDGFYSYTFKLMRGYEHPLGENTDKGNITILVADIAKVELFEIIP